MRFVFDVSAGLLANHCVRSYLFAREIATAQGLRGGSGHYDYDDELVSSPVCWDNDEVAVGAYGQGVGRNSDQHQPGGSGGVNPGGGGGGGGGASPSKMFCATLPCPW